MEELIQSLKEEINALKTSNGELSEKLKEMGKQPSANPVNVNAYLDCTEFDTGIKELVHYPTLLKVLEGKTTKADKIKAVKENAKDLVMRHLHRDDIIASVSSSNGVTLTADQITAVQTARGIYNETFSTGWIVAEDSPSIDICKLFLRFLANDYSIEASMELASAVSAFSKGYEFAETGNTFDDSLIAWSSLEKRYFKHRYHYCSNSIYGEQFALQLCCSGYLFSVDGSALQ